MLRFYRLVLVMLVIFAGVLFLAHLLGEAYPSAFAVLFTNPDGSTCENLCLYGVRPGTTSSQDAVNLLQTHPLTRHMRLAKFALFEQGPARTTITLNATSDGGLNSISLDSYSVPRQGAVFQSVALPESGSLGDIIAHLGDPMLVVISADMWLYYADEQTVLIVRTVPADYQGKLETPINPSTRIAGFTLYRRPLCPPNAPYQFHKQWVGFTKAGLFVPVRKIPMVTTQIFLPCRP